MAALRDVVHRSRTEGTLVILSDVHSQPVVAGLPGDRVVAAMRKYGRMKAVD